MWEQNPAADDTQTRVQKLGIAFSLGCCMVKQDNALTHRHGAS